MWDSNAEVIVLVDRGTPGGSRMILEAREHLLMLGRRNAKREVYEGEIGPAKGCFVLAPVSSNLKLVHGLLYFYFSRRAHDFFFSFFFFFFS